MTELQTTEFIESPFIKVNKGMEMVGNWPNHIRSFVNGTAEEAVRCACFYFINKKTPKLIAEIMTDEITSVAENIFLIIQNLAYEVTGKKE